ncbi:hypothetical protein GIB67_027548 [Kingdonia uniflora]|uniref:Uncharacterized protein n=1 Tax=Kingdonia uniflora TaxID=39325 RepID=A0A7J7NL74_9MAGN|nr:hypothetical protein GIB67_027548 [Kingdonia uniflora]
MKSIRKKAIYNLDTAQQIPARPLEPSETDLTFPLVADALYWFYEYCRVGHPIVNEEVKFSAYLRLRAWVRGNRKKTNDQTTNLFILGRYHIDHRTIEMITWQPWLDSAVSELDNVRTASLLSRKRMPLQVPNGNCEYYLGDRYWSMSLHLSLANLQAMRQAIFIDCEQFVSGEERETYASYWANQTREDAQRLQELTDENATLRRHLDSVDDQLYAHDLHLRRGRDVRVVSLPPGGSARMRWGNRGSGLQTKGAGSSRSGPSQ